MDHYKGFAGSTSQPAGPVGDHLNVCTPLIYDLAFAVDYGDANSGALKGGFDFDLQSGLLTLAEPARAVFCIVDLIIIWGEIEGDAGICEFFLLRCSPVGTCWCL